MSEELQNVTGAYGTISNITPYRDEIEKLIGKIASPTMVSIDPNIEDVLRTFLSKTGLSPSLATTTTFTRMMESVGQ